MQGDFLVTTSEKVADHDPKETTDDSSAEFQTGGAVMIQGLSKAGHLNGSLGTLGAFDEATGR